MEFPREKGVYVLIAEVTHVSSLEVGRLGVFNIVPGYYAYVGSACGSGGLRARLNHHLESDAGQHWHIDYLMQIASPIEIWCAVSDRKLEKDWAQLFNKAPAFRTPIPRFGSSDYRRSSLSHLFYSKRRPNYCWFAEKIGQEFEPEIRVQQFLLV